MDAVKHRAPQLRIGIHGRVLDFGVEAEGGIEAGLELARVCLADLAEVSLVPLPLGDFVWPHVQVRTDHPTEACLYSQYAGWKLDVGDFRAMGSGPMRAAAAHEELFDALNYRETTEQVIGVLESEQLPGDEVREEIAERTGTQPDRVTLCVAPTASQAGNAQIVARSVETALHKLREVGFDVRRVRSGWGTAPLPPVATDFLEGLGRTNDAILYGGRVTLWVTGDDGSLAEIGPMVPSNRSKVHGQPFLEIFKAADGDFYNVDPYLFSPAEVVFQNLDTGMTHRFGEVAEHVLRTSFRLV